MKMFQLSLFLFVAVIQRISAGEVCYGDLGCFHDEKPFTSIHRPVPHLPRTPEEIGTEFWLFTRSNKYSYQILKNDDGANSLLSSNFAKLRKTKMITHGYTADGNSDWIMDLKNAILDNEAANIIVIDWRDGAAESIYGQAAANTQVVGAEIAKLIDLIQKSTGAIPNDFHLMGHSLGAHVSGYAGEKVFANLGSKVGRITGLDPADPYFEGTPAIVRLDPTDASFVDAIHTDGDPVTDLGWGMMEPVGHADFYPNGGTDQPGCPGNEHDPGNPWKISCSHSRAHELMVDSVKNRNLPMLGYRCSDYDTYVSGGCNRCDLGGCPTLGYYSDEAASSKETEVKYYLTTGSVPPYSEIK